MFRRKEGLSYLTKGKLAFQHHPKGYIIRPMPIHRITDTHVDALPPKGLLANITYVAYIIPGSTEPESSPPSIPRFSVPG